MGILAVDADGRVELQNPEASRILGQSASRDARPAAAPSAWARSTRRRPCSRRRCATGATVAEHGCRLPRPARRARAGRRPDGVTDRRRARGRAAPCSRWPIARSALELEDLLGQRARSELFAQLAAGIAHELRNPLGGIRGAAELLLGKLSDPALARYAELIRGETERMRRLLDDLAELTRGGDLRPRRANLHRVIDDLVELHSRSESWRGIQIAREYDPSIPEFEFDPDRTTQVLLNLVRNAVQAMAGKGTLTLRTRIESGYHLEHVGPERARHGARSTSRTPGPGIPDEDLPLLFTPFFTRRSSGTGLGPRGRAALDGEAGRPDPGHAAASAWEHACV